MTDAHVLAATKAALEAAATWCLDEADKCDDAARWGGARRYVADCKASSYALRNAARKIADLDPASTNYISVAAHKAAIEAERAVWVAAIEHYFDATAVMDVERYADQIRKGPTP